MAERDRGGVRPGSPGTSPSASRRSSCPTGTSAARRLHRTGDAAGRGCQYAQSGEHGDPANQVNVEKSNQVNFGAFRGFFLEPAPRSSRMRPPGVVVASP